jgi:ADP-ribosylglycohydrolase
MKANTPKDRAVGAIMGTFIGDALGVGPHLVL